jgi:NTP pyrophosphatase (non-canonical NTP hydrolase)
VSNREWHDDQEAGDIVLRNAEHLTALGVEMGSRKVLDVREPVRWFAEQMERKLKANDHKGGWDIDELWRLMDRLNQEAQELRRAFNRRPIESFSWQEVIDEAADVANFAMMLADRAREKLR